MFEPGSSRPRVRFPSVRGGPATIVVAVIVIVFLAIFASSMLVHVQVGNSLLLVDPVFKKDVSNVVALGPTWQIKMPWEQPVVIFYATDSFEATVPCFSKDQLEMNIQIRIRWSLDPAKIRQLYLNYPRLDYETAAIRSITEETIRLITKKYTTVDTIEFRDVVALDIQEAIVAGLRQSSSLSGALTDVEFDLKNIEYPATYTRAIEAKLVKEQEKIAAEFERERTLILANATAQRLILEAQGQAQARTIVADSVKQAIELIISSSGTTNQTDASAMAQLYLTLDTLRQIAPDVGVLIIGGTGTPFIYQLPQNATGSP